MIRKTPEGHQVLSENGKPLSKPTLTLAEAKTRLRQVDYFKWQASQKKAEKDK